MTRKDYIQIAKVLREHNGEYSITAIVETFVEMLELDNPNFDAERFIEAVMK